MCPVTLARKFPMTTAGKNQGTIWDGEESNRLLLGPGPGVSWTSNSLLWPLSRARDPRWRSTFPRPLHGPSPSSSLLWGRGAPGGPANATTTVRLLARPHFAAPPPAPRLTADFLITDKSQPFQDTHRDPYVGFSPTPAPTLLLQFQPLQPAPVSPSFCLRTFTASWLNFKQSFKIISRHISHFQTLNFNTFKKVFTIKVQRVAPIIPMLPHVYA